MFIYVFIFILIWYRYLLNNTLSGSIPPEIGKLSQLIDL